MTYLDPEHARQRSRVGIGRTVIKIVAGAAILAFGYLAMTIGGDDNGRPNIVSEPQQTAF